MYRRILVVTDHPLLKGKFQQIVPPGGGRTFDYRYSAANYDVPPTEERDDYKPIHIKRQLTEILASYDLVISLHSKQIFPPELVERLPCINVHPGLNPHNRGWYPHVFSIVNGKPAGATIHVMDRQIDHGPIIAQLQVPIYAWDTSAEVYDRVVACEIELLRAHLPDILNGTYQTSQPASEGSYNAKDDFRKLCEIKLEEHVRAGELIDRLRALTHGTYRNAFFIDEHGNRINVRIVLERDGG